jgi:transposase InsO family protein
MIVMEGSHRLTLEQMSSFLAASGELAMEARSVEAARKLVGEVLSAQQYRKLPKAAKGTVRQYLMRVTGYGRAQIARMIREYGETGKLKAKPSRRRKFPTRYTRADIEVLASVDTAHQGLSGAAVRRLLERGLEVFQDAAYERLARISVSHIYNLRNTETYRKHRVVYKPTQSTAVAIGERRCPEPKGAPGWLLVDTVHQGDPRDGKPGLYHINAVDTVTQWQVVGCVETISERHLLPVLEAMMHQFPFRIRGFHSDNGSEFINHRVAGLLEKLRIAEFTKSRANRTTDNALVEGKNGAVVRKYIGYGHLAAEHAEAFQRFYMTHLNPYLNFHRPCGFAEIKVNNRGKRRRRYPVDQYRTPYEKLQMLPDWQKCLKKGMTAERLAQFAATMTDTECARRMQQARDQLLARSRAL